MQWCKPYSLVTDSSTHIVPPTPYNETMYVVGFGEQCHPTILLWSHINPSWVLINHNTQHIDIDSRGSFSLI